MGDIESAELAIGHTRWATHGKPTEENAHPHRDRSGKIAVVHNGIIENYAALREQLQAQGHEFEGETDTEVFAHLIGTLYEGDLVAAVEEALDKVDGTFALGVICEDNPELIVGARRGSPLAIGIAEEAMILASDKHFMLKEIHEQPAMLEKLVRERILNPGTSGNPGTPPHFNLEGIGIERDQIKDTSRIVLIAQGTAYHAGMVARNMIERVARIPCSAEYASDFRYRDPILDPSVLVIAITQSGETLDTLEGVRIARQHGCRVLSVVNVVGSTIARESDDVFYMNVGPEIGVASTKAFTGMIASLYIIAIHLGLERAQLTPAEARRRVADLRGIGNRCDAVLSTEPYIKKIALKYKDAENALFLGRGTGWPIAMEGALKLKEVSYIHAEGYNAAEMKHGPIALIDENMPVCVIALKGRRYDMILGNIQEVKARGGRVVVIASHDDDYIDSVVDDTIYVRAESGIMNSIVASLPLQLLSYYIAEARGCDVDKPKNLAKSVTVK
jgi:glucosamine--fructose-6-phosphate aminotransferase (isomerizing)